MSRSKKTSIITVQNVPVTVLNMRLHQPDRHGKGSH